MTLDDIRRAQLLRFPYAVSALTIVWCGAMAAMGGMARF